MSHESLLNAYVFDYLKKRGFLRTALLFADECKGLPLAEVTSEDPTVDVAVVVKASGAQEALGATGATQPAALIGSDSKIGSRLSSNSSDGPASAPVTATGSEHTGGTSPTTSAGGQQSQQVPAVNIPFSTTNGFLSEWWSIFWDVFSATSERRPSIAVSENARTYVQHQNQRNSRRPSLGAALNANGKRPAGSDAHSAESGAKIAAIDIGSAQAMRGRRGDRSPQSAALAARYSQMDELEHPRPGLAGVGNGAVPTIPRGPGVNISSAGEQLLSDDYPEFLSRSKRAFGDGASGTPTGPAHPPPQPQKQQQQQQSQAQAQTQQQQHQSQAQPQRPQQVPTQNNAQLMRSQIDGQANSGRADANSVAQAQVQAQAHAKAQAQRVGVAANGSGAAFSSPRMANAPVPRTVPTQRALSNQAGSPLTIHQLMSPVQAQRMGVPQPGMAQAVMPPVGPSGPQLPSAVRQGTIPATAAGMGMDGAQLSLAATAGLGRNSVPAMMAYAQQVQAGQTAAQPTLPSHGPIGDTPTNYMLQLQLQQLQGANASTASPHNPVHPPLHQPQPHQPQQHQPFQQQQQHQPPPQQQQPRPMHTQPDADHQPQPQMRPPPVPKKPKARRGAKKTAEAAAAAAAARKPAQMAQSAATITEQSFAQTAPRTGSKPGPSPATALQAEAKSVTTAQTEAVLQSSNSSIGGLSDSALSALLAQKSGPVGESALANELGLNMSDWLGENSTDALQNLLGISSSMNDGMSVGGGNGGDAHLLGGYSLVDTPFQGFALSSSSGAALPGALPMGLAPAPPTAGGPSSDAGSSVFSPTAASNHNL
ncbi:hypothetical protein H4R24_005619 [Coemansia sp. RSA 988]|nr:hypothetical protein H4R24_005619 [Coemansia sp. RSA 988]